MSLLLDQIEAEVDQDLATQAAPPAAPSPAEPPASPAAAPAPATSSPVNAALREMGITRPAGGDGGVAGRWWTGMSESVTNLTHPPPLDPNAPPQTPGQQAAATLRR